MTLAALNEPITTAERLLRDPTAFFARIRKMQSRFPELAEVLTYFQDEYCKLRQWEREQRIESFKEKILPFSLNPTLQAIVAGTTPGINWAEVAEKKQIVLLDFRYIQGEMRRFLLLWVFDCIYAYIKALGRNPQLFGLIIDEFVDLTHKTIGENPLTAEMNTFLSMYMRQHNVWLSIGLQSPLQLDANLQQTVLSLGSYLFGQPTTPQAAHVLANAMFLPDPYKVKDYRERYHYVPAWKQDLDDGTTSEPLYFSVPEQRELSSQVLMKLKQYQYLLRPAVSDGEISTAVYRISIRDVDRDWETGELRFPDTELLAELRPVLAARSGIPITPLATNIQQGKAVVVPAPPPVPPDDNLPAASPPPPAPADP